MMTGSRRRGPIIDKLALGFKKMLEDKSSMGMIKNLGDNFHYLGPDEFAKLIREDSAYFKDLIKRLDIKVQ